MVPTKVKGDLDLVYLSCFPSRELPARGESRVTIRVRCPFSDAFRGPFTASVNVTWNLPWYLVQHLLLINYSFGIATPLMDVSWSGEELVKEIVSCFKWQFYVCIFSSLQVIFTVSNLSYLIIKVAKIVCILNFKLHAQECPDNGLSERKQWQKKFNLISIWFNPGCK